MSKPGFLTVAAARVRQFLSARAERWAIRRAVMGRAAREIVHQPTPRWIGEYSRAAEMAKGDFTFRGRQVVAPRISPWRIHVRDREFMDALHGFEWLDDFAAASSDADLRRMMQSWLWAWILLYRRGAGLGWRPELAGRRLAQWLTHAPIILRGVDDKDRAQFLRTLDMHARYLSRRWRAAPRGLPRFEAAAGLIFAGLCLKDGEARLAQGIEAVGRECDLRIGEDGGVASRNPEQLAEIMALLSRVARTLEDADLEVDPRIAGAIERVAPTLRAVRLGDGGLARFHGGGAGRFGLVEHALAEARVRARLVEGRAMGFLRMQAGRTALVLDAAPPPTGRDSLAACASTLAFEMSSGRRRLVVNQGPGAAFGGDFAIACRATQAHSTLSIGKTSSAQFLTAGRAAFTLGPRLYDGARNADAERTEDLDGGWITASHDGYWDAFGLTHERRMFLAPDGSDFQGEDTLSCADAAARKRFDRAVAIAPKLGLMVTVRFHIHPDAACEMDPDEDTAVVTLPNGEVWAVRQTGGDLSVEPSVYHDLEAGTPRATKQIVVTARAREYWGQIIWAFRRVKKARPRPVGPVAAAAAPDPA